MACSWRISTTVSTSSRSMRTPSRKRSGWFKGKQIWCLLNRKSSLRRRTYYSWENICKRKFKIIRQNARSSLKRKSAKLSSKLRIKKKRFMTAQRTKKSSPRTSQRFTNSGMRSKTRSKKLHKRWFLPKSKYRRLATWSERWPHRSKNGYSNVTKLSWKLM